MEDTSKVGGDRSPPVPMVVAPMPQVHFYCTWCMTSV